jgi:hypothetical protein
VFGQCLLIARFSYRIPCLPFGIAVGCYGLIEHPLLTGTHPKQAFICATRLKAEKDLILSLYLRTKKSGTACFRIAPHNAHPEGTDYTGLNSFCEEAVRNRHNEGTKISYTLSIIYAQIGHILLLDLTILYHPI